MNNEALSVFRVSQENAKRRGSATATDRGVVFITPGSFTRRSKLRGINMEGGVGSYKVPRVADIAVGQ